MKKENSAEESWDMLITPAHAVFQLRLKDVWAYRDLLWLFVKRDFVSFYKQTVLGPLWFFIQPFLTTVTFTFIFGKLAGIGTDGIPQPLFYMAGITAWNYFADCLVKTSSVFRDNAGVFGKVYFPRLVIPLSIVCSNLVRLCVQLVGFMGLWLFYYFKGAGVSFSGAVLLFPVLIFLMAFLGLGMGMIISALTTKYRDLTFLLGFGVQLLMYGSAVIIPLSETPAEYAWLIKLNPMTSIIETFRYIFLGKGSFSFAYLGYSFLVTAVLFFSGLVIFNKVERNFIDTV